MKILDEKRKLITSNLAKARDNIDATKPSKKYSHVEGLFHRSVDEATEHKWFKAYVNDVEYLLSVIDNEEEEDGKNRKC